MKMFMKKLLKPDLLFQSVEQIDFNELKLKGVKYILLDLDNTLIDYEKNLKNGTIQWVENAKKMGFDIYILSNTNKTKKVDDASKLLEISYINNARKPFKKGFLQAIEQFKIVPEQTAMVGDQVLTDVVGANRMKMISIYVTPISKKEHFYTSWKRPLEAWILNIYKDK